MPRRQRRRERMDGKRVNGWGGLDWCTHIFYITSDRYRQTVSQTDRQNRVLVQGSVRVSWSFQTQYHDNTVSVSLSEKKKEEKGGARIATIFSSTE